MPWYLEAMVATDEALMRQVQSGDLSVFEELVRRYRQPLFRVTSSKLGDRSVAEDVVQEALLAAFAARHTFDPHFSFRTWLWTIALRLCHKHWKRSASPRSSAVVCDPAQTESATSAAVGVLEGLLQSERSELLQQALTELPEPQADALRLRFFGGLPYDEIAAAMDSSVSGAKQRVKHGLERLAERLKTLSGVES
ncbi:MAG: hypothetical protein B7Z55_07645 [Planctomycetales bacterium 12-60-4]|nr:MAG: hypothetical protein B7Z55_07645 [Planctomycetales bacterium 12-60-4]